MRKVSPVPCCPAQFKLWQQRGKLLAEFGILSGAARFPNEDGDISMSSERVAPILPASIGIDMRRVRDIWRLDLHIAEVERPVDTSNRNEAVLLDFSDCCD